MHYPEVIDYSPLHIDAQKLHKVCARYGADADALETVGLAIAGHANPWGDAFPGLALLSELTGYTIQEVSRLAHILQSAGVFIIRKVKSAGARYAHNVYHFAKSFIRRVADVNSAHFIGNLQKWKAAASDVAAAVKTKARAALDNLSEQAAKMAAVFQEKPELMDAPEQATQTAGIAETPETLEIPAVSQPSEWESFGSVAPVVWEGAQAMPEPTTRPEPVQAETPTTPPSCYQRENLKTVYASWRDRVKPL